MNSTEVQLLLDKYWEGETSLEEENSLREYMTSPEGPKNFPESAGIFGYFQSQQSLRLDTSRIEANLERKELDSKQEARVFRLNPYVRNIAAALLICFGGYFIWQNQISPPSDQTQLVEIEDPKEALKITKQALAFLGHKMDKGDRHLRKNIAKLNLTNIIKEH